MVNCVPKIRLLIVFLLLTIVTSKKDKLVQCEYCFSRGFSGVGKKGHYYDIRENVCKKKVAYVYDVHGIFSWQKCKPILKSGHACESCVYNQDLFWNYETYTCGDRKSLKYNPKNENYVFQRRGCRTASVECTHCFNSHDHEVVYDINRLQCRKRGPSKRDHWIIEKEKCNALKLDSCTICIAVEGLYWDEFEKFCGDVNALVDKERDELIFFGGTCEYYAHNDDSNASNLSIFPVVTLLLVFFY